MIFDLIKLGTYPLRADRHRLAGTVYVDGAPARRLVVVIDRVTLVLVASKWSDPITGAWEINGLDQFGERRLLVVAMDDTGNYNAEVADYVSQVIWAGV